MLLNLLSKAPGRTGLKKKTDNLPPGGALPGPKIYCIFNVYLLWIKKIKIKKILTKAKDFHLLTMCALFEPNCPTLSWANSLTTIKAN